MQDILDKLDEPTKAWASVLSTSDFASILQLVYRLPEFTSKYPNKPASAVNIGQSGECKFKLICEHLPENYKLNDTTKHGKKGDFVIKYTRDGEVKSCMVDVKNYATTIPKKEVEKFQEDLLFGNYDAGLILSYNSKFVGISDHIYVEQMATGQGNIPVMYVTSDDQDVILQSIQVLFMFTTAQQKKELEISRVESLIEIVNHSLVSSADTRRLLNDLSGTIGKSIQECQRNLMMQEVQIKRALKEMSACVSKVMLQKILPHVPKIESRSDNTDPNQKIEKPLDGTDMMTLDRVPVESRPVVQEFLELEWQTKEFLGDVKQICQLTSKNMSVVLSVTKTKIMLTISFQEELEIPNSDFEDMEYRFNKDDDLICTLNEAAIVFLKVYM